tara:strand:+ start:4536 stop:4730 length:195 start_codon:yes stop_codon:yes gene_type:complete
MTAERQRRYRQRMARGERVLGFVTDPEIEDGLVGAGFLAPINTDDPEAVLQALRKAVLSVISDD